MKDGQRVEVRLCRGERKMKVELDEPLPDVGIPKIFTEPAICDWIQLRHSPASPQRGRSTKCGTGAHQDSGL